MRSNHAFHNVLPSIGSQEKMLTGAQWDTVMLCQGRTEIRASEMERHVSIGYLWSLLWLDFLSPILHCVLGFGMSIPYSHFGTDSNLCHSLVPIYFY
jgi:hypothetical protein